MFSKNCIIAWRPAKTRRCYLPSLVIWIPGSRTRRPLGTPRARQSLARPAGDRSLCRLRSVTAIPQRPACRGGRALPAKHCRCVSIRCAAVRQALRPRPLGRPHQAGRNARRRGGPTQPRHGPTSPSDARRACPAMLETECQPARGVLSRETRAVNGRSAASGHVATAPAYAAQDEGKGDQRERRRERGPRPRWLGLGRLDKGITTPSGAGRGLIRS